MTSSLVQVVQFVHPGFEYQRSEHVGGRHVRAGVMRWKRGNSQHDRKFILTRGSLFEPRTERNHQRANIVFWGEWEGPSVFWKLESPGKPKPSIVHAPFRPERPPTESVQNTDPMVFGETFIYSNCLQHAYVTLRTLVPGSIVLFGRHSRVGHQPAFSLDTCLVVERVEMRAPLPFGAETYGEDLLADAVLSPLQTEGAVDDFTVYFGRTRGVDGASPFSFFPARLFGGRDVLFARPRLSPSGVLEGVISPDKMQGIKVATVSEAERDAIWQEVVRQVSSDGCALGHHAAAPPVLALETAASAAQRAAAPLT
jgi:hypothetical protein